MSYANDIMTAAIERSKDREAEVYATEKRIFPGHCSGAVDSKAGRVCVSYTVASGVSTRMHTHLRQVWELNGKRIAQEKLIAALNNA